MSGRPLVPCPSCNRHVFADACTCPFCDVTLHSCALSATPRAPRVGRGRAALMAAAASLLGMSACGGGQSYGTMGGGDAGFNRDDGAAGQVTDASTDGAGGAPTGGAGGGGASGSSGR